MNKFKIMKILLATDGSDYSNLAAEELAARPLPPNSGVHIVSVYSVTSLIAGVPEQTGGWSNVWEEVAPYVRKMAEEAVSKAAELLKEKQPGLTVSTRVIEGLPKEEILQEAENIGADLIVVGSHGRGAVARFLLGSVSQAIALHAKCSVEIARKPHIVEKNS